MTVLFDITIQHTGWSTGSFSTGGWDDYAFPLFTGAVPQSYYLEVIAGGALDVAAGFTTDLASSASTQWFNTHSAGPLTGLTSPTGVVTTQTTYVWVYTRVPSNSTAFIVRLVVSDQPTTAAPSTTYCAYGTRLQPSVGGNIILTSAIITGILTRFGGPGTILATAIDAFVGRTLYTQSLCASPPPVMPVFTNDDWVGGTPGIPTPSSLDKFWAGMQAAAWPYFCECVPAPVGNPAPIDYPGPNLTLPTNPPAAPLPFTCDGADVCTMLNQVGQALITLSGQVAQVLSLVTLIQRQKVPFSYVPGVLHSGLTGAGELSVSGILGLAVQLTTVPAGISLTSNDPTIFWRAAWVALGTQQTPLSGFSGWRKSVTITHNPMWIDAEADDTVVGYTFVPGVVANIQTFLREP